MKSGERFDVIIGVARGGLIPARIFSDLLGVDYVIIVRAEHYRGTEAFAKVKVAEVELPSLKGRSVLLTDDVADTGESLLELSKLIAPELEHLRTLCLFKKPSSKITPDFYQEETDAWIIFPWERLEAIRALGRKGVKMENIIEAGLDRRVLDRLLNL